MITDLHISTLDDLYEEYKQLDKFIDQYNIRDQVIDESEAKGKKSYLLSN